MNWCQWLLFLYILNIKFNSLCCDLVLKDGKLIFASVIFSAGDHTPLLSLGTEPSNWQVGLGQLTNFGKRQHFELGEWLRRRYNGRLISNIYRDTEFHIHSADVSRAVMSARTILAALFAPEGNQFRAPDFQWQPIPVHTRPVEVDPFLSDGEFPCPAYDYGYSEMLRSEAFRQIDDNYRSMYQYLSENTGTVIDNPQKLRMLYDTLTIESSRNGTLPVWSKNIYPGGSFEYLSKLALALPTLTPEMARLRNGVLLKNILDQFTNKTRISLRVDRSLWMYSGLDTTVAGLLNIIGPSKLHKPPNAACLIFELRLYKNMHYVQIFYKDSEELPDPMYIPGCGQSCPLRKMYILYANSLPSNELDVECALPLKSPIRNYDNIVIPVSDQNFTIPKSSAVGKLQTSTLFICKLFCLFYLLNASSVEI